ncbi:MAG: hypothetical protein IJA90_11425 [Peptococcaceae bacterium]|nr:hypothetical protein [Peptococcaceae bacterium]
MEREQMRSIVENYKKMQLYSIDYKSVEFSIVDDLAHDLDEASENIICEEIKRNMIAKVVAYMEFGLCYENNKVLLDKIMKVCDVSKKNINELVDKEARYVKTTKANIQKIIIWKSQTKNNSYMNKGVVIEDIISHVKNNHVGRYIYSTDICKYELIIEFDIVILRNIIKDIEYYLL